MMTIGSRSALVTRHQFVTAGRALGKVLFDMEFGLGMELGRSGGVGTHWQE